MTFETFYNNATNWAKERKIIPNSNNKAQYVKLVEELGELALGVRKQNDKLIRDSIGDIAVVLVILAGLNEIDELKWKYKKTNSDKNFFKLSDRIGSIGAILADMINNKNILKAILKSEIKKTLYILADYANELGYNFYECLELSWNEIKDRKGYLREDGIFIKDEDIK